MNLTNTIRQIYTSCGWSQAVPDTGRMLGITSAVIGEGKSSLARAMAIATARDHAAEVLLIECDLLRPSLSGDFGMDVAPGLSDLLAGDATLDDSVRRTDVPNLSLLPAGNPSANPSRLLRSAAMNTLLEDARRRFAFTILDLPAVLQSSDASVLAGMIDGVVLVVRARATEQGTVQRAVEMLAGAKVHGVVLNRAKSSIPRVVRRVIEQ